MQITGRERVTLTLLGVAALTGLSILLWQRQVKPLRVEYSSGVVKEPKWDKALSRSRYIDINLAATSEIERLPGVGPALALRIVEDREANGFFDSPDSLRRVEGIGRRTIDNIREYITVVK